jgi:hypothetical protein
LSTFSAPSADLCASARNIPLPARIGAHPIEDNPMNSEDMLARLLAQAAEEGVSLLTLRALVEEASELGARRTLAGLGLDDEKAPADLIELRQLLRAWRDAKASAWKAVVEWIVRGVFALLLLGLAWRLGLAELLK